jgi:hypothetical protein
MINEFEDNPLAGALQAGLNMISQNQTVVFNSYKRVILPLDGYVFWLRDYSIPTIEVFGSLHYSADQKQELDNTISFVNVLFTTNTQIANLEEIQPDHIWIGSFDDFQFTFSSHGNYYDQAELWHYEGHAVYPEMRTQVIENATDLPTEPIVSNSLPLWLQMGTGDVPVFPSFLVPENLTPPYVVCHIGREDTRALQPIQIVDRQNLQIYQLMADKVRFITYGLNNEAIQNFVASLYIYNEFTPVFGFMQEGVTIVDVKHIQSELNVIAQQKEITFEASYVQSAVYNQAVTYIKNVLIQFIPWNP